MQTTQYHFVFKTLKLVKCILNINSFHVICRGPVLFYYLCLISVYNLCLLFVTDELEKNGSKPALDNRVRIVKLKPQFKFAILAILFN